ncbi:MAG: hypothetical protein ACREHV_13785, partial [Rhizomicrobium sp.]
MIFSKPKPTTDTRPFPARAADFRVAVRQAIADCGITLFEGEEIIVDMARLQRMAAAMSGPLPAKYERVPKVFSGNLPASAPSFAQRLGRLVGSSSASGDDRLTALI